MSDAPIRRAIIAKAMAVLLPTAVTFEGIRYVAYYDPPGILTVCVGGVKPPACARRFDPHLVFEIDQKTKRLPGNAARSGLVGDSYGQALHH